jgi:stage III sporulation protein SpoIIIAA
MIGAHRTCKCGAVYDRSEHILEAREISSFECAVCGATIENWNSAWGQDAAPNEALTRGAVRI